MTGELRPNRTNSEISEFFGRELEMQLNVYNAETFAETVKSMKRNGTAFANSETAIARQLVAGFLEHKLTKARVVAVVLAAYGNPKKKSGKAYETLSGLDTVGAGAVRKAVETVIKLAEELATDDCPESVLSLAVAFARGDVGAPKGVHALKTAINAAAKAAMADSGALDTEAEAEAEAETAKAQAVAPVDPLDTMAERIKALASDISNLDGWTVDGLQAELSALRAAIDAAASRIPQADVA